MKRPKQVDIEHLPESGSTVFGREDDLRFLDEAWDSGDTYVVSLVAQGGVGKSALVRRWLAEMERDGYRGAVHVKGWSFYSQGIGNRLISAEVFVNYALREWFGDTVVAHSSLSSWEKGERLARHLQEERSLLVLDGLEPLQSPLAGDRGRIRDLAIASLLRRLSEQNPGLCVITTRQSVTDLVHHAPHTKHRDLEQISTETGREILRHHGIKGKDVDLENLSQQFCNHALTVTLLGAYLNGTPGSRVENAREITALTALDDNEDIDEVERLARRVIAALAARFGDYAHSDVLHLLGLFDRPITHADLEVLREKHKIPGLTDHIWCLSR